MNLILLEITKQEYPFFVGLLWVINKNPSSQ